MKYYKLVANHEFIGVVHSGNFFAENARSGRLVTSNEILGQFVEYKAKLYRDYWMQPVPNDKRNFSIVNIEEISQEEYERIIAATQNNKPIIIEDDDTEPDIIIPGPAEEPDEVVDFIRNSKIKEMNTACRNAIELGFDLDIRGESKHFSLTTQDQLNLMSLNMTAQTQQLIPYHADGEVCEFYTAEEINEIITAATQFKNYNIAYYNSLKAYIETLTAVETISEITYGISIPDEYKSDVLKVLEY